MKFDELLGFVAGSGLFDPEFQRKQRTALVVIAILCVLAALLIPNPNADQPPSENGHVVKGA